MEFPGKQSGSILIIVENLPVPFDRRVWMEATTLHNAGYQVSVICPTGQGCESLHEEVDGIQIYRHKLPPEESSAKGYIREYSSALWAEWRLARRVKRVHGFDVIHACNPPDLIFLVALWFKIFYRTRFLFDHHDLTPELYESKFKKRGFYYQVMRVAERLTFALADKVISTNESYRSVAIERGHKKLEDVMVVRSGPDLSSFKPVAPNDEYKHGHKWLVGYMGVMGEFDGVDHLVRVAEYLILNKKRMDIQFCFIGSGPCLEDLKIMSEGLGLSGQVEFTGRISDEEMIARLSSCDVCVDCDPLNPLNDKSTMNKILEYMALARPIVQYDLLEGRRSAENASLYAEPNNIQDLADKIEELLADENKRHAMGMLGRERMINELEWRHQVPRLLNIYKKLFELV